MAGEDDPSNETCPGDPMHGHVKGFWESLVFVSFVINLDGEENCEGNDPADHFRSLSGVQNWKIFELKFSSHPSHVIFSLPRIHDIAQCDSDEELTDAIMRLAVNYVLGKCR